MGIKFLSIIFTFVFLVGTAQASFWDILSSPLNYFSDLYSGDDTEVVTGESVVSENDAFQDQLDDNSDQSIYDINLDLNSSYDFGYAPSVYSPTFSTPNLSFGVEATNYGMDYSNYSTCNAFDFSLCVFCFNPGLFKLDDFYENQCKELYTEVPDQRTDEDIDGYCACNENKNSEMFSDGSVKDFIAKAVEKKKLETAGKVISNFKKIAKSVNLPSSHSNFRTLYDGDKLNSAISCSSENFGAMIKELTTADRNGSAACKQDSIDELLEMAAKQSKICKDNGDKSLNERNREHCDAYSGFDDLPKKLARAENFEDKVATFQNIFTEELEKDFLMIRASILGSENVEILLRDLDSSKKSPTEKKADRDELNALINSHIERLKKLESTVHSEDNEDAVYRKTTIQQEHDRKMINPLSNNPKEFSKFLPGHYAASLKEIFQDSNKCTGTHCLDLVRTLATEPYIIGPMMKSAKSKTKPSPEMIELLDRVKKNNDNSPLNDLGPADLRILEAHSQNILENFKVDAKKLLENQFKNDIPKNLARLDKLLAQNTINLDKARKLGNVEKEREIKKEIERQKNVKNDLMVMQDSFQKLLTDPESLSLEALGVALASVQNAQSSQLDQACNAVKTQFEAYCRLKETEDSSMYSAVDVLGLDFNENKRIANSLENKEYSKKVENPKYLAILDAMTCIERGRYTKYPENTDNPVFVTLSGSIEQCDKKMDVSDSFPKFLSTREGAGQYMAMLAPSETWEEWNRCGGTKMKNEAPNESNLPLDPDRGTELADVYKQTLGDVADNYISSSNSSGGNNSTIDKLKKFKEKYGDIGASSFDSDFVSNGGGSSSNPQNNTNFSGPNSQNDIPESEISGSSRGLASSSRYSNGATTIQNNGTVQYQPFVGENGETFQSQNLIDIENRIKQNNDDLVKARESSSVVEKKIAADGAGNASSEVLDQLAALRKQIEELRKSNEKLALERKLEIEKLKQEDLEASIADANKKNSPTQKSVVEPKEAVAPSSSRKSVVNVNSGNGSNGVGGGNISNSGMSNNAGGSQADSSNTIPSETRVRSGQKRSGGRSGSVFLTGRTSSGEEFNISTADVLNFEGRSDITSFDSAVSIALQSDKNAFIFEGKVYVKKGDNFIEVKDIEEQERALASDQEVGSIDDVKNLVQRLEQKEQEAGDEEEKSVDNISVKEVQEEAASRPERDRKEVEGLWNIIKENIFNFGS